MSKNQSSVQEAEACNQKLKTVAWSTILIITVPQIIYRLFIPHMPGEPSIPISFAGAEVGVLSMLCLVSWGWSTAKQLRGFILALLAIYISHFFIIPYIKGITLLNWMNQVSWGMRLVINILLTHMVLILVVILSLIGSGLGRKELFLVRGNPRALFQPIRFLPDANSGRPTSWTRSMRSFLPTFIIVFVIIMALQIRPGLSQLYKVLISLPFITIAAAINAFSEEFEYRSVLLARLVPVLGSNSAILISSVFFGLMHYLGGRPGGPIGFVLTGSLGFLMAKSMIETRGFVWAFLIHFVADVVLLCSVAASI